MDKYTEPHFTRSALITIDTQNDFSLENAPAHIPGTMDAIPNMVRLLEAYRNRGLPIVHVVRLYDEHGANAELSRRQAIIEGRPLVVPGTQGAELVEALKPDAAVRLDGDGLLAGEFQAIGDNEFVMYKPRWGAFYQTRLEAFLQDRDIDTLVFCGCNFPNCPRTSIYEASERDFRIVLVTDAISRLYPKGEEEIQNIGVQLMSSDELVESMTNA